MGRPWTAEEKQLFHECRVQGMPAEKIARKLGRSINAIQWQIYFEEYPEKYNPPRRSKAKWMDSEVKELKEYRANGYTEEEIAKKLHRSESSVHNKIYQLKHPDKSYHAGGNDTRCLHCDNAYADRCEWIHTADEREIDKIDGRYEKYCAAYNGRKSVRIKVISCPNFVKDHKRKRRKRVKTE